MNKGLYLLSVAASLSMLTFSSCAFAGNAASDATLTLGGGYDRFDTKRNIDNTGVTYASLAYNLTTEWGVEALLGSFISTSHRPEDDGRQVRGALFALDGIYRFLPRNCFEPYVVAGPGATGMSPNGYDAHVQGNVNAGVGAQYFISKSIALKVEVRDFYTFVGGKNDVFVNGGVSFLF